MAWPTTKHIALWLLITSGMGSVCQADVVHLVTGGRLIGEVLPSPTKESIHLLTDDGALLSLAAQQVKTIDRDSKELNTYRRMCRAKSDSATDQWEVAEWCQKNGLETQRKSHLQQILARDPNHVKARQALGYYQFRGEWVLPEEAEERVGMFRHKGGRRTRQEIELMEAELREERQEWSIYIRLRKLRELLNKPNAFAQRDDILNEIRGTTAPLATRPVIALLNAEPVVEARILFVEVLGKIGNQAAWNALIEHSLVEPDFEVFQCCLENLPRNRPAITKKYIDSLRAESNIHVNRSAIALAHLGDTSAITPLVDALITTHKVRITPAGGSGAMSTTFSSVGQPTSNGTQWSPSNPSMSAGEKKKFRLVQAKNEDVLSALVKLTKGQSFGYDLEAWRTWLAVERSRTVIPGRRVAP